MTRWTSILLLFGSCLALAQTAAPDRLIVGGDANYPPYEWLDESGRPQGFNVELIRLLAGPETEIEFRLTDWPATMAALDAGEVDIVPMFASEARRSRYRFSSVYAFQTHALFGRPEAAPIDSVDRVAELGLVVGVGSYVEHELRLLGAGPALQLSKDTLEALRAVAAGDASYALVAERVAAELIRDHDLPLVRRSPPFWPQSYAFAVRSDRMELADWLQARLVSAMADGRYLALFAQWWDRLEPGQRWSPSRVRAALWLLAGLLTLLVVLAAASLWLRRQVAQRTREIAEELARRRQAEHQARTLARQDPVTGLANVRHFCIQAGSLLAENVEPSNPEGAEVLLVRLVDIDSVVRAFGYGVAERMVLDFARALERSFDGPLAHLGRGTFAVFDTNGRASTRLDLLQQRLREVSSLVLPRFLAGSSFASVKDVDVGELLQQAELALVESQQRQCRWSRYHKELEISRTDLELLEDARSDGLEGLCFFAQPQVDLIGRRIRSGELLARWTHPLFGELTPAHFIPLFESAGLVTEITRRAIDAALAALIEAGDAASLLSLSINVTARDLIDPGFADGLLAKLRQTGLAGQRIKLEITETSLVRDPEAVAPGLERLAEAGLRISLDDFGTGYSSLDYISRFPIHEVKVDGQFVSRMLESERDRGIVRSTIHLAHELGLTVIGEGAETPQHLDLLAEFGCDLAQGWAAGHPERLAQFIDRARQQPARSQ